VAQVRILPGAPCCGHLGTLDSPVVFWKAEIDSAVGAYMTDSIALGFDGLFIAPGTHICALFRGIEERDQILIPFLREGMRAGQKCTCIIDDGVEDVRVALGADDWTSADAETDQLAIRSSKETYLRQGVFSTQAMLAFWDDSVSAAINRDGFPFVRSAGETTWTLKELPGLHDFMTYEAELNQFVPRYPQVILCLYDLDNFNGQVLVDILKTHPKVLMGGTVLENLHYMEPEEFLASRK
jgi:MEDS: MEthanogen/methylotroph, DcmR Sensory domain